jgi:hypothetical protein
MIGQIRMLEFSIPFYLDLTSIENNITTSTPHTIR